MHIQALGAASCSLTQFQAANETYTYQLDGRQQLTVAQYLALRAFVLEGSFDLGGIHTGGWLSSIFSVGVIFRSLSPFINALGSHIQQYRNEETGELEYSAFSRDMMEGFCHVTDAISDGMDKVIDFASPFFETICVISYIAIIFFGSALVGGIGLLGCLLTYIKRSGHLPSVIDNALVPVCHLANFYSLYISPLFFLSKFLGMVMCSYDFLNYLVRNNTTNKFLPSFLTDDTPGVHIIDEDRELDNFLRDGRDVEMRLQGTLTSLRLNPTYIYADEVTQVVPPIDRIELDKQDIDDLFDEIDKKIEQEGITIKNEEGWETLKTALKSGSPADSRPANFDETVLTIKAILVNALTIEDHDQFNLVIQELSELGGSCNEGWLRGANYLLNPKTRDVRWMVHYLLSKQRSQEVEILLRILEAFAKFIMKKGDVSDDKLNFDMVGGINNVHLLNQVEAAMNHRIRSFNGQLYYNVNGKGLFTRWYQRSEAGNDEPLMDFKTAQWWEWRNLKHILFVNSQIVLPLPLPSFGVVHFLLRYFQEDLLPGNLVERIYDANTPQYTEEDVGDGQMRLVPKRDLEWEDGIQDWLIDLDKRSRKKGANAFKVCVETELGYNPLIVEQDPAGNRHLTREGVKLLLWDQGILEECKWDDPKKIGTELSPFAGTGLIQAGLWYLVERYPAVEAGEE